jgi:large subunit ribosomal protein L15
MQDFNLRAPAGANRKKRVLGRGTGSGRGTTSGKGHKGQKARSGGGAYVGFEGGQMPLYRRVARRGFSNHPFKKEVHIVNLDDIEKRYQDGETVNELSLNVKGLLKTMNRRAVQGGEPGKKSGTIKVLGNGDISRKLTFEVDAVSAQAKEKIEKAGGTVNVADVADTKKG